MKIILFYTNPHIQTSKLKIVTPSIFKYLLDIYISNTKFSLHLALLIRDAINCSGMNIHSIRYVYCIKY